jgi:integrase
MPRRGSKGARLWLEPEERRGGRIVRPATWVIRDGGARKVRTGCARDDREGAERKLADYIARKYQAPRESGRDPAQILILDVLNIYAADAVPKHKRPAETMQRLLTLGAFPGWRTLADVNGKQCRAYVAWRTAQPWKSSRPDKTGHPARMVSAAAARRELEDLRAAINHHRKEGLCSEVVGVALPDKGEPRDAWLTRDHAAQLLWAAWRAKQVMQSTNTKRDVGKHVARFILTGLYTGTRHAAICGAAFQPAIGRGYVDLDRGVFHRKAQGVRETKKRQPPVRLPNRLLAHLRRWHRLGIATHAVVEWNGQPVRSVRKAFASSVKRSGIGEHVTPHILRHTAATWAMQNGGDLWQIAGYLGMTPEMLTRVYGHHHPDFQRGAAESVARSPGQAWDKLARTKRDKRQ